MNYSRVQRGTRIVKNGLVLYLDAANPSSYPGSGNTWFDLTKYQNNGTLINGFTYDSANGGSIVFDGNANGCAVIPGNTTSLSTLTVYTMELLIKATYSGNRVILEKGPNAKMLIQPDAIDNMFYGDFTSFTRFQDTVTIFNGNWIYICVAQSSTFRNLYINNQLKDTTNLGNAVANSNDITLMSRNGAFAQSGNVSIFRIYNRVLTTLEIQQNYNAIKGRFGII